MALTAARLFEDLSVSNDFAEDFAYRLEEDGESIYVEEYADSGEVIATYTVTLEIKEN
ncbi:hypothetical protein [Citricoccus sp. K5]|uniref:hypothetical protein n=1 Tax=Citricoccus sp. K5 TaxID=2653135 RepID=UPI0012F45E05|nr:hypothetical protein [Citricoccus sp. K5]VXB24152.1 conserved hypothetical protein [Citricoccus sp. K5]